MYYLKGDIITDGEIFKDKFVEITNHEISYVGNKKRKSHYPVYEVKDGFICPGLVDIHIHAISGFDFMDSKEAFTKITKQLIKYGVTSILATSRTGSLKDVKSLLESAKEHMLTEQTGSQIIGVHLEGPWISSNYSGAQPKKYIRKLTWEDIKEIIDPYKDIISLITIAPEEVTDLSIIEYLNSHQINVSAGHTNAMIDDISIAIDYGLKLTTHTFNAMTPVHHRNPGTATAALLYDELTCEVISDGLHVHPKVIELLYKVKGKEGMVLISDCTGYDHLADGNYHFRNKDIVKKGNKVTLDNGILAGSAITLNKGIKYAVENCNIPLEKAIYMATQSPLTALGHEDLKRGRIKSGYEADIIILDSDLNLQKTIINGKIVYERP